MFAPVRWDGMDPTVMSVFHLEDVGMEAVKSLWNVIVSQGGPVVDVVSLNVRAVPMDVVTNLINAFVTLDGKDTTAQSVKLSQTVSMENVSLIHSNVNALMDGKDWIVASPFVELAATPLTVFANPLESVFARMGGQEGTAPIVFHTQDAMELVSIANPGHALILIQMGWQNQIFGVNGVNGHLVVKLVEMGLKREIEPVWIVMV